MAAFDKANMRRHLALVTFVKKTRARYDEAAASAKGKPGITKIEKLQNSLSASIASQAEALRALDPDGSKSRVTGDHDTNLHYIADEYPAALVGLLSGDPGPIQELRGEMDKLQTRIESYLGQVAGTPSSPPR
jgi:hypothetical protein